MVPRSGLDEVERRKIPSPRREAKLLLSSPYPVAISTELLRNLFLGFKALINWKDIR
jgi:hypothetical protein